MVFVFFFQAEDGIRDATVTGVQTYALPIWAGSGAVVSNDEREQTLNQLLAEMDGFEPSAGIVVLAARSEERRVGKECRSRWAADHETKRKSRERREAVGGVKWRGVEGGCGG